MSMPILIIVVWAGIALLFSLLFMMGGKRIGIPKAKCIVFTKDMTELQRIEKMQEEIAEIEKVGYITGQYLKTPGKSDRFFCDCSSEDLMKAEALHIDYFHTKKD